MRNTTIVTLAAIAGLLVAGSASAGLIVADGFETSENPSASQYEADVELVGQDPDIAGFDGAWDGSWERFATRTTGINGFFTDEAAGGLEVTQTETNSTRDRTRSITGDPAEASKTYWFAFSANFAETTGGGVSMGYSVDDDPVDIGMEDGTFTYKTSGDGNTQNSTFGTANANTDYLFISWLDITGGFDGGTDETFNAWVFSADDFAAWDKQESTLSAAATALLGETVDNIMYNGGDDSGLSAARLEYIEPGDGNTQFGTRLDEYRISSDFDGLNIVPEPATMTLLALGGLGGLLKRKR